MKLKQFAFLMIAGALASITSTFAVQEQIRLVYTYVFQNIGAQTLTVDTNDEVRQIVADIIAQANIDQPGLQVTNIYAPFSGGIWHLYSDQDIQSRAFEALDLNPNPRIYVLLK